MEREVQVVDDIVGAAVGVILALRPRTIALAGGGTPRPVYERLRTAPFHWPSMHVFFGDERCVPPDHPDSNLRMAREALLDYVPANVHPMPGDTCDAGAYEAELHAVFGPGIPRFDLIILGLGEDGHTASLFPGDPALEERERLVARVERPDHPRLTLTLPVLSAAKVALFLVAGAAKREAFVQLLFGDPAIPASHVTAPRVLLLADPAAGA